MTESDKDAEIERLKKENAELREELRHQAEKNLPIGWGREGDERNWED